MNIKQLDASNAYARAAQDLQQGLTGRDGDDGVKGQSAFSALVSDALSDVAVATQNTEVTAAKALVGQADMIEVATAVQNAEMVVQTVVKVRDKVIAAYNDILKMPI
ncbi:MAG: flagellar hook-basal body complex protein FliE [Kordiimonadaceae bacterium]|nr:flagellar hook-basal body complex protein FliE [Kordiimonadaceae bacterium]